MDRIDLGNSAWTLAPVAGSVPEDITWPIQASVPGCVHTDLRALDLIPDPYLDLNEETVAWIGHVDWEYTTEFDAVTGRRTELVCEGLDTVASISVNGTLVARTENMHRSYRFDVTDLLSDGKNSLVIRFDSAIRYAEEALKEHGYLPQDYTHPYNFIRKMASNFGWDWGPTLVTAGIWRPIRLEQWDVGRFDSVRIRAEGTRLLVDVDALGSDLDIAVSVAGQRVRSSSDRTVEIAVPDAELWWPVGYGDQPLYDVTVELSDGETVLDTVERRVGFRTIDIDTSPDQYGSAFIVRVNGKPIFVKGANWIPDDCFVSGISRADYAERIGQAREANMNLLRVWGGGIYESEDFYELCDEQGLLVWQDFLFACAGYPETEPFRSEIEAEAREAVTRLGSHPSLAVWNGSNETLWGWHDWRWPERTEGRPWGEWYYMTLLPQIVGELAPGTPYIPSSPFSPTPEVHPNHPAEGTTHSWDVWNRLDYQHYRDSIPRFVAEYGFQSPPTLSTLVSSIHDEPLEPRSPGMLAHQKQNGGAEKLDRNLIGHFPTPTSFTDWHLATSLNQAHALKLAIEHFRSWWPRTAGSIIWQLNDCWPVSSWALVDSAGQRKLSWYAVRDAYADRLLTIQSREAGLSVVLVNDTDTQWAADVALTLYSVDGHARKHDKIQAEVPARSAVTVPLAPAIGAPQHRRREVLIAESGSSRAVWKFVADDALALPEPRYSSTVEKVDGGHAVTVTAETFLSDLVLMADNVDTALVTLLPGESHTFIVRVDDPQGLVEAVHCANEVGRE